MHRWFCNVSYLLISQNAVPHAGRMQGTADLTITTVREESTHSSGGFVKADRREATQEEMKASADDYNDSPQLHKLRDPDGLSNVRPSSTSDGFPSFTSKPLHGSTHDMGGTSEIYQQLNDFDGIHGADKLSRKASREFASTQSSGDVQGRHMQQGSFDLSRVTSWDSLYGNTTMAGLPPKRQISQENVVARQSSDRVPSGQMPGISELVELGSISARSRISRHTSHGSIMTVYIGGNLSAAGASNHSRHSSYDALHTARRTRHKQASTSTHSRHSSIEAKHVPDALDMGLWQSTRRLPPPSGEPDRARSMGRGSSSSGLRSSTSASFTSEGMFAAH